MAETKVFNLRSGMSAAETARATAKFLEDNKNLEAEVIEIPKGFIIQARQKAVWKRLIGMDNSTQVHLFERDGDIVVTVGSGEWIDKAGAAAAGLIFFTPLAVTAAAGTIVNFLLPDDIFRFIERFVSAGGIMRDGTISCLKCGVRNDPDSVYCKACGAKLTNSVCAECGAKLRPSDNFCTKCGASKEL